MTSIKEQEQTIPLRFPLYTLEQEGDERTQSPFPLEVNQTSGETTALLFTTEEAIKLFIWRRNLKGNPKIIRDARELIRLGQVLMTRFSLVSKFMVDPSGGTGPVHFAQVKDMMFSARDSLQG